VKILFIGDIVGKPGRRAVRELVPEIMSQYGIDVIIEIVKMLRRVSV